jgi:hypothetical protein
MESYCSDCKVMIVCSELLHQRRDLHRSTYRYLAEDREPTSHQTRGGTCCPGGSTPKNWPIPDSSKTNHKPWRSQPSPPFQTLLKPQHWTSPQSPHITTDGRPTLSTLTQAKLNIIKMERLVRWLKTIGLSSTTNHKTPILKYEDLGNQLMHATSVY